MNPMSTVWLALMIVFLVGEGATAAVTTIWFAAGALAAMIASFLGAQVWLQSVIFGVVSVVLLLALRPFIKKYITPKQTKTNIDAIIGKEGLVTQRIDNIAGTGKVKLDGMEWSARSTSNEPVEEGTLIKVDRIEGVKVFVSVLEVKV